MPRYTLPDGIYNPVWVDGERATKDPIEITWNRPRRGRSGSGKPLFSRYESATLRLGILHEEDFSWWKDKWMEDGDHVVIMPCEDPMTTGTALRLLDNTILNEPCTFTGVYFEDLRWTRRDEFHYGVTAIFSHILVS